MVREHLELAGEDCNLRELLLLPLHNVRLVLRKPVKQVVDDVGLEDSSLPLQAQDA